MDLKYILPLVSMLICITSGFLTDGNDWDSFVFSQTWPPGTCAAGVFEKHTCFVPEKVQTWTVHGLWPSNRGGKTPEYCRDKMPFDFSKISKIKDQMDAFWPNLYNDTEYDSFWSHEWDKHGTCSLDLKATSSELDYFNVGLNLNQEYNISRMLKDGGVVPNATHQYSYSDFMNAIKKEINVEPVIECAYEKLENGTGYHLIYEIEICLDKQFKPISCYSDKGFLHKRMNRVRNHYSAIDTDGPLLYKARDQRSSHHVYEPQSNCPRHYNFNYPPIKHP